MPNERVEAINWQMEHPPEITAASIDDAVASVMNRVRDAGVPGLPGEVFSLRAICGEALASVVRGVK